MKIKSKIAALAVTGVLSAAVVITTPAHAAGSNLCPANMVCLYQDRDFVSLLGYLSGGQALHNASTGANDKMSSWENKSKNDGSWYDDINGLGTCHDMLSGTWNAYVGDSDNDKLSSWRTNAHCPTP